MGKIKGRDAEDIQNYWQSFSTAGWANSWVDSQTPVPGDTSQQDCNPAAVS